MHRRLPTQSQSSEEEDHLGVDTKTRKPPHCAVWRVHCTQRGYPSTTAPTLQQPPLNTWDHVFRSNEIMYLGQDPSPWTLTGFSCKSSERLATSCVSKAKVGAAFHSLLFMHGPHVYSISLQSSRSRSPASQTKALQCLNPSWVVTSPCNIDTETLVVRCVVVFWSMDSVIRSLSQWICENNCQQLLSPFIIMEIQPPVLLIAFSFALNFSLHLFAFIANATAVFLACVSSLFAAYFLFHNFSIFLWKMLSMSIKSQWKSLRTFLHIIVCFTLNSHWRSFPSCQNHF